MALSLIDSPLYASLFGDAALAAVLSDSNDVGRMVLVERCLARVQGKIGVIPNEAAAGIYAGLLDVEIDLSQLAQGTASTGVPIPTLLAELRKHLTEADGQWLHWGATSQDIIDTAHVLGIKDALEIIGPRLSALIDLMGDKSDTYKATLMAGRTRGQIASPTTFGLRIAHWAQPLIELEGALDQLRADVLRVQFGGATGTNAAIAPHGQAVNAALADTLGVQSAPPWHVDRNGTMHLAAWLLNLSTALSKIAGDLILMMRNEIAEARAGVGGGSSAMPQKANPVGPETVRVLATLAKAAHAGLAMSADHAEERDGAQWPLEWALLPQMLMFAGAGLTHSITLLDSLEADAEKMRGTMNTNTGVMAEQASYALAAHMPRLAAQDLVKQALATGKPLSEGLSEVSDVDLDWTALLDPKPVAASCMAIADQIFARRDQMRR